MITAAKVKEATVILERVTEIDDAIHFLTSSTVAALMPSVHIVEGRSNFAIHIDKIDFLNVMDDLRQMYVERLDAIGVKV